jgi:hypothetical protein
MVLNDFAVRKLTADEVRANKENWDRADKENHFIPTDDYWVATFELDGERHSAGIRHGRRTDVAAGTVQLDVQLFISDETFEADTFMPEARAADILRVVGAEFGKVQAFAKFRIWEKASTALRFTALTNGQRPEMYTGEITAVDEDALRVSVARTPSYDLSVVDFEDSLFTVGNSVVAAERPNGDLFSIEAST